MERNRKVPLLEIKDLTYAYESHKKALNAIDLQIHKGEKLVVLGANGAGKSTFFLNLNGVLHSEEGEIIFEGEKITRKNLNILRKNIGIVFQDPDEQIIASTVKAEVSFGPMNLKLSKEEVSKRVEEALSYMNIVGFKERPPHYLSGGEKKRVSIADIIAMKTKMIIFDEPTASLDPVNAAMLEEVLEKLSEQNQTLMISTHDVEFAYRWAERIVVFCEGQIIADGKPIEVFKNDEVLQRANLKKPILLEVVEALQDVGLIDILRESQYPKSIEAFKDSLKS